VNPAPPHHPEHAVHSLRRHSVQRVRALTLSPRNKLANPSFFFPPHTHPSAAHHTSSFAVNPAPAPTVELFTLIRRNLACTPVTVRASPAALVLASMSLYSASTSAMAACRLALIAVGAVPKSVCQRTTHDWLGTLPDAAGRIASRQPPQPAPPRC
jgi:hypothetical protein